MARWKTAAADRGYSFAEFIRACLDAGEADGIASSDREPVESVSTVPPRRVVLDSGLFKTTDGKRTYEPDFKKPPAEKTKRR